MNYQLIIECRHQVDVMERILRVIRHRGFALQALEMNLSGCGERINFTVVVDSCRPIHLLIAQVEKLHDVLGLHSVNIERSLETMV